MRAAGNAGDRWRGPDGGEIATTPTAGRTSTNGRPPRAAPSTAVSGFVLLEAIVGLALIVMVAAAAFVAFAQAAERSARAGDRLRAVLAADAILARVGLDLPLRAHRTGGTLGDGAAWTLEIRPFAGDEAGSDGGTAAADAPPLTNLFLVAVRVTPAGARGAPVELATLRLREPPP